MLAQGQACPGDVEGAVSQMLDDGGVGDGFYNGTVNDDEVVERTQYLQQFLHAMARQKFGGVGRHRTYGHDVEGRIFVMLIDGYLWVIDDFAQIVCQTDILVAEEAAGGCMPHVAVNTKYLAVLDGKGERQVHADESFSRTGKHGSDNIYILVAGIVGQELNIGTDETECLIDGILAVGLDDERIEMLLGPMEGEMSQPPFAPVGTQQGYFTNYRQVGTALNVLLAVDGVVKAFLQEEDDHWYGDRCEEGCQQDAFGVGEGGKTAAMRHVNVLGGYGCISHADFVLFLLLQEIEVEAFLYFLVTLH